jgi:MFS family permease
MEYVDLLKNFYFCRQILLKLTVEWRHNNGWTDDQVNRNPKIIKKEKSIILHFYFVFSLVSVTYMLGAPVCGWFIDRWPRSCPKMMLSGSLMCAVAILFMGPSPLIPLTKSIASMCGSFLFLGVAISLLWIPTFQHCINAAKLEHWETK